MFVKAGCKAKIKRCGPKILSTEYIRHTIQVIVLFFWEAYLEKCMYVQHKHNFKLTKPASILACTFCRS